mmetsp:Transcript_63285/g.148112  ORF Transcript_63285/g.148112 Transcript_63285/m.148112 type:complete len:289 (+) Transcript_63285:870-1736(+)
MINARSMSAQSSDFKVAMIEAINSRNAITNRKIRISRAAFTMRVMRTIRSIFRLVRLFRPPPSPSAPSAKKTYASKPTSQSEVSTIIRSSQPHIQSSPQKNFVPPAAHLRRSSARNKKVNVYWMTAMGTGVPSGFDSETCSSTPMKIELERTTAVKKTSKAGAFTHLTKRPSSGSVGMLSDLVCIECRFDSFCASRRSFNSVCEKVLNSCGVNVGRAGFIGTFRPLIVRTFLVAGSSFGITTLSSSSGFTSVTSVMAFKGTTFPVLDTCGKPSESVPAPILPEVLRSL